MAVKFLSLLILFRLLLNCKSLATRPPSHHDLQNLDIISKKNGLSTRFSINSCGESAIKSPKDIFRFDCSLKVDQIRSTMRSTFLPNGFPEKTPTGYLEFSIWSWIQDLSTQLRAIIATQRVLEGVGVGRQGATALSASINFIVRDGCGMASTLMFTAASSSKFRSDVKKWRLFGDIINDVGITLEVAATIVPRCFFLPMICK